MFNFIGTICVNAHAMCRGEFIDSLEKAKSLPCVFNNWAVFYGGKFVTVNQLDGTAVEKIVKKGS